MEIRIHDLESAPEGARALLADARSRFGFVPNLLGAMAGAPALLEAYLSLQALFDRTSLSATERQVVLLEASATNGCEYCVGAHTAIAGRQGVAADVIGAIREGTPIADERLEALRALTREVVTSRGWPSAGALDRFVAAGYGPDQLLEVILGVGMKTLSNYTNHAAGTPLDPQFAPVAWKAHAR